MKNKKILLSLVTLSLVGCNKQVEPIQPRIERINSDVTSTEITISRDVLEDKLLGGIIGHAIGLGTGWEFNIITGTVGSQNTPASNRPAWDEYIDLYQADWTEGPWLAMPNLLWAWCGGSIGSERYDAKHPEVARIYPFESARVSYDYCYVDDDYFIDYFNEYIFDNYGINVSSQQIYDAWMNCTIKDVGGGFGAMNNMQSTNFAPPYSGRLEYGNNWYWGTESWIENDILGINFPYMPVTSAYYADMFSQAQGASDTAELAKILAVAGSLMYQVNENYTFQEAFEDALEICGKDTREYDMYQFVKEKYNEQLAKESVGEVTRDEFGLLPWRECCLDIYNHRVDYSVTDNSMVAINAMFGFIAMGVIFGENDFTKTTIPVALAGLDGDCSTASIVGLLGTAYGYSNFPEDAKKFLNKDSRYINDINNFCAITQNYPTEETMGDIFDRSLKVTLGQIEANGGSYTDETVTIKQEPIIKQQAFIKNYDFTQPVKDNWEYTGDVNDISFNGVPYSHTGQYSLQIETENVNKFYQVVDNLEVGHEYKFSFYYTALPDTTLTVYAKGDAEYSNQFIDTLQNKSKFSKAELTFVADKTTMELGFKTFDGFSTYLVDDFRVQDMSMFNKHVFTYEAEKCRLTLGEFGSSSVSEMIVKDSNASNGKMIKLAQGDIFEIPLKGKNNVYTIRVHYNLPYSDMGSLEITLGGIRQSVLPVCPNGMDSKINIDTFMEFNISIESEGTYALQFLNYSFFNVFIDFVEVFDGILNRVM